MIRAIMGTIAVLAGFAVVETSNGAGLGPAGSCKVTEAYMLLRPGERVLVRAEPTPEGTVLAALAARDTGAELTPLVVTVTGSKKGWARITLSPEDYAAGDGRPHAHGWLPADVLAVNTRLDGVVTVYDRPGLLGDVIGRIENQDQTFRMLGCRGSLLQVINATEGNIWIDRWCAKARGCRS
ncbi:hypothetical protein [Reyranella sp.]|jgi:hypothetical protein|uniref:hypothetical protein n=1 Tax=Reyranella sp. TaxID=1929291 RepID=UPI002F936E84